MRNAANWITDVPIFFFSLSFSPFLHPVQRWHPSRRCSLSKYEIQLEVWTYHKEAKKERTQIFYRFIFICSCSPWLRSQQNIRNKKYFYLYVQFRLQTYNGGMWDGWRASEKVRDRERDSCVVHSSGNARWTAFSQPKGSFAYPFTRKAIARVVRCYLRA